MPPEQQVTTSHPDFGIVNYGVLVLYLLGMLGIGWWSSRRVKSARGFFIAEGKLNHVIVGISLLGTYLSALTMMALSALAFGPADMTWSVQIPFLLVTAFVITRFVLAKYREAGVISVYEFLERRIHVSSRLLASLCFWVFAVAKMAINIYLPALAFHVVTGFNLEAIILVTGVVVIFYTVLGGIEAVIWTDVVQVFIFTLAPILTLYYIFTGLGDHSFWEIAKEHHKLRTIDWSLDVTKAVTVWLVLQTVVETIRIYSTQQEMTQRYMTTESTAKANRSVWISIIGYIPLGYAFYFIGAGLFVYYQVNPDPFVDVIRKVLYETPGNPSGLTKEVILQAKKNKDAIYPYFVATRLPVGIAGAVIAGFFAASMSTISSLLNSASTVIVEDFLKRFAKREETDAHYLMMARVLTIVLGVLATVFALCFIGSGQAIQEVFNILMGILMNGVLGLMALAFLPFRVNKWAALIGFAVSYLCLFYLMWGPQEFMGLPPGKTIHFLLRPVICNPVCFLVALGVDAALPKGKETNLAKA